MVIVLVKELACLLGGGQKKRGPMVASRNLDQKSKHRKITCNCCENEGYIKT